MPTADAVSAPGERAAQPNPWWTKRAAALHVTLVVVVPVFLGLFWWQVQRVRQGNTLSWAYVFEWPFFTGYAVYLWWKLVHDQPGLTSPSPTASASASEAALAHDGAAAPAGVGAATGATAGGGGDDRPFLATGIATAGSAAPAEHVHTETASEEAGEDHDDELAAYNRYLAELNASGRRKSW